MIEYAMVSTTEKSVQVNIVKLKEIELNRALAIFALWNKDPYITTKTIGCIPRAILLPSYRMSDNATWVERIASLYGRPATISIMNRGTLKEMGRRMSIIL